MNKVILPVAVLAAGAAAYFFYTSQTADVPVVVVETPAVETQPEPVEETVEETVQDAVEATQEAAEEAAESIEEQVESAIESATELAEEAAQAVDEAVEQATEAATAAADAAAEALTTEPGTELTAAEVETALSAETFDYDRAVQVIDASSIGETQKTMLKSGLNQARNNPALLESLLQQVRTALGM